MVEVKETCIYALQMAQALAAIHTRKMMHRDLKPANFVVSRETIKLLDFGLAKIIERIDFRLPASS
ncbi:MAG TPA: protein kinase [Bryobacteraceae bacterium]